MPAEVVAIAGNPASSKIRALATSHAFGKMRMDGPRWSCRNCIALLLCDSITFSSFTGCIAGWLRQFAASFILHALDETGHVHHGAPHRPPPDFLSSVMGTHAHRIKPAVKRFQFRLGVDSHPDPAGCPVFDVDRDAYRDFSLFAERLQGIEAGRFHQSNHIWSRIDGWQLGVMGSESVLEFDGFIRLAAYADGDGLGHDCLEHVAQNTIAQKGIVKANRTDGRKQALAASETGQAPSLRFLTSGGAFHPPRLEGIEHGPQSFSGGLGGNQ